jgi:hypothetical protein
MGEGIGEDEEDGEWEVGLVSAVAEALAGEGERRRKESYMLLVLTR